MPPSLALFLWFVLLLALLRYDSVRTRVASASLWIPTVWLCILSSRLPSQWLGTQGYALQAVQEGNSLDRATYLCLIVLAVGVLVTRSVKWTDIVTRNFAILGVLTFALVSVVWSDFPFVAFKRWIRDLGLYLAILIVLSDPHPLDASRTVLRRLGFLLIPLSILLFKYYPEVGRQYEMWSGEVSYVGATTSKNMLGLLCLVTGLVFIWDTLMRWRHRHETHAKQIIMINLALIAMTVWLMSLSNSVTSGACFVLGCAVMAVSYSETRERRSALVLKILIPIGICLFALLLGLGIDIGDVVAPMLGRDVTLTGRTEIWKILMDMQASPVTGAGYESFWLGSRLERVWQSGAGRINQAHNGYLQVYLNLGALGVSLLVVLLTRAYLTIWRGLRIQPSVGSFGLALWTVLVVYNMTEAAFLGGILWAALLMFMGAFTNSGTEEGQQLMAAARVRSGPIRPTAKVASIRRRPGSVGVPEHRRSSQETRTRRVTNLYGPRR